MIKISLRPNLIYPIQLIIWTFLRKIVSILISKLFVFKGSIIYTFLMFLGELIGGFILYQYQKSLVLKKTETELYKNKYSMIFVEIPSTMHRVDNFIKIYFLIFVSSFFDFSEFMLSTYTLSKISYVSSTLQLRLCGFLIVTSSLICGFILKFKIHKHHIFSISIIIGFLIILIITEYFFQSYTVFITKIDLSYAILFSAISQILIASNNSIEKYLFEFDYLNPFWLLMLQGIIGFIYTIIFSFFETPIPALKSMYKDNSTGQFIGLIFLLLLYSIFGALKNIYRMYTNMIFSPMYKNLADLIINPIYLIYYFIIGEDFINEGERNYLYFFLNLIILIIFDFCSLVYNEFIILFCCHLEYDTYASITRRASNMEEMDSVEQDEIEYKD